MRIEMKPIGFVHTEARELLRHWSVSDTKGTLFIEEVYREGLKDIKAGQYIVVLFHFHQSAKFTARFLTQVPPHRKESVGVFSICSPIRPNPIGMSVLKVVKIRGSIIHVEGLDMLDGTPILDIKPHIEGRDNCPRLCPHW